MHLGGGWQRRLRAGLLAVVVAAQTLVLVAAPPAGAAPAVEPGMAARLGPAGTALTSMAAAGDSVHVVHQDRTVRPGGLSTVVYRRSEDGGRTFAPRQVISSLVGGDALTPVVAAAGDDVVIAWKATTSKDSPSLGNAEIFAATSTDGGRMFGPPVLLDADTADSQNPTVVTDGTTAHVAWSDLGGRVSLARTTDRGATWSPARELGRGYGAAVSIAQDDAHLAVAWAAGGVVRVVDSTDRGATFPPARELGTNGYSPKVAVIGVTTVVAWGDWSTGSVQTIEGVAGVYGAPVALPASGQTWVSSLVADDRGHLLLTAQPNTSPERGVSVWSSTDFGGSWTLTAARPEATSATATVVRAPDTRPEARLTYTAAERFRDHDGDGILDERQSYDDVHPSAFSVELDGCRSTGAGQAITAYHWTVEGDTLTTDTCTYDYVFEAEGAYPVDLEIELADGTTTSVIETVVVRDLVVVSIGDSVGSGEGNPDVPHDDFPVWQDHRCHRSASAGSALAARQLEVADPQTSVTFIHLACSGASITGEDLAHGGLLTPYEGIEAESPALDPQVHALGQLLRTAPGERRPIDALFISIGANDAHFSDVVKECLLPSPLLRGCHEDGTGDELRERLATLPARYAELAAALEAEGFVDPQRVFLTEYFDPTTDERGAWNMDCVADQWSITPAFISATEARWASEEVVRPLNAKVAAGAAAHGWNLVTGIADAFRGHGYCSSDSWVVGLEESYASQDNKEGSFHPNRAGHRTYGRLLAAQASAKLADLEPAPTDPLARHGVGDAYVVVAEGSRLDVTPMAATAGGFAPRARYDLTGDTGHHAAALAAAATASGAAASWTAQLDPLVGGTTADYAVYAAGPGEVANIALRSVQLVQAPSGASILVGGKSTTVRARIANDFATEKTVMARLTYSAVDAGQPVERVADVAVRVPPGVHDIGLPPDAPIVIDPDLTAFAAEVELDPFDVISEVYEDDDLRVADGDVVPSPKLRVLYVPLGSPGSVPGCPAVDGLAAAARPFLAAVLPVADDKLEQRVSCEAGLEADASPTGVVRALADLGALARTAGYDEAIGVTAPGWLQGAVGAPMVGAALDGSDVPTAGVIVESGEAGDVVAHEIAHTFGLGHEAGVEAPGWWPAKNTEQTDTIDIRDPFVQERPWISAATYEGLHTAFSRTLPDPDLIVVRGSIDRDGNVDAPPWVRDVGLLDVELGDPGELTLEYRGAGDELLGTTGFDATAASELPDAGVAEGFAVRAPVVDGMARLVLRRGATVLVDRPVSAATPTVTVDAPPAASYTVGSTIPLAWTASDADGDALTYTVLVSDDAGATWTPIATDLTEASLAVHASRHVLSPTVRFRVLATDGINTGRDDTDADLSVVAPSANGRIAFEFERSSGYELLSVNPDGSGLELEHEAAPQQPSEHEVPAYSRDGSMIAYTRRSQLFVLDPSTGVERLVYVAPGGTGIDDYPRCPRFSPDGTRILMRRGTSLVTLATDGSGGLTTVIGGSPSCGDWHPRTDRIAYVKRTTHSGTSYPYAEVRTVNLDGSDDRAITDARLLVDFPEYDQWIPKWSPAGDEIVILQESSWSIPTPMPLGFGTCNPRQICAVAADGSSARQLTNGVDDIPSWMSPYSMSWSGDGNSISMVVHQNGLYVKNLETGAVTRPFIVTDYRRPHESDWQWLPGEPPAPAPADADAGGPYAVDQGQPLQLDASATRRRAGEAPAFTWDVDGDGDFDDATGVNPTVTIAEPGTATIAVRVTDPDGTAATDEATVTVADVAPSVSAPASLTGAADRPLTLTATFTDPFPAARTATVDWGDGESSTATVEEGTGSGTITAEHTYATAGPFTATVEVCEGATCRAAEVAVDITDDARPAITEVSPAAGPSAGGTEVVLFGDRLSDVTEVRFGDVVAAGLEVLGDHAVRVVAPAGAPGAVDVVATGDAGAGDPVTFTYTLALPPSAAPVTASSRTHAPVLVPLAGESSTSRPLTYEVVNDPVHGTAEIVDAALLYTPTDDTYDGVDSFTYRALDDRGGVSAAAPVDVLVGNRAPAAGAPLTATADAGVEMRLASASALAGATDPDGDELAVLQVYERLDTRGFVTLDGDEVVFVPDADAGGLATFDVLLGDPYGGTTMATVQVDVEPAPETPASETPTTPTTDPAPPADVDVPPPTPVPVGPGYRMAARDGGVFTFGSAAFHGSAVPFRPVAETVGLANGGTDGYWLAGADGGVFSFGDAPFLGSLGGLRLNAPIVGIAATPSGAGYWLVASDGGVFAFGDAPFAGSVAHLRLNAPIVGIASSPSGLGYLLVGADGGVFAFGDAAFLGSAAGADLGGARAVAILADRRGYRIVTERGRVRSFGTADLGDVDHLELGGPIVGGAALSPDGFLLVGRDGGAFTLGAQGFAGSLPGSVPTQGVVGGAATSSG